MRTTTLAIALLMTIAVAAQKPSPNWGRGIEQAGNRRTSALLIGLGGALLAGAAYAMDKDNAQPAIAIGGICLTTSFVLNFSAARKERHAGRMIQNLK